MASLAHAGTSTSIPGSVIFDEGQEPADDKEIDIDVMAGRTKRELVEMKALKQISTWLRFHNFREMDVNEQQVPSPSGCFVFRRPECMCPLHVAAKLGHEKIVKSLLMARADPKRKTSRGRTALEIARKADVDGSHHETVEALAIAEGAVSLRRAVQIMGN
mmetsp:Transcript_53764/g.126082  ORF Transcript_53764/g.126082 Transcript_53764/m.126082 type:complete len:161 (+) Transcript_53764:85-567(+)